MPFNNNEYGPAVSPALDGHGFFQVGSLHTSPPDIVTPAVPAASIPIANTGTADVFVYFSTTGTGVTITLKSDQGTTEVTFNVTSGRSVYLPVGWTINLGAYTVAPTWTWVAV